MSIPINEQETVIHFYRDEPGATIDTTDSTVVTKLEKLRTASPEHYSGIEYGRKYRVDDKGLITFRKGRVKLSEEQKAERAGRFKKQTV